MSKSTFLTARIEPKLKQDASQVLSQVGMSTSDAITLFLRQVVLRGGLPFSVRMPKPPTGVGNQKSKARERKPEVLEPMHERLARDRDPKGLHRGKCGQSHPSRRLLLEEDHVPTGA